MTTVKQQSADDSVSWYAERGMDLSGHLLPEVRDTVSEKIFNIEPLCREDNELARQVARFLDMPGVGYCEGLTDHFQETRAFFVELKEALTEMLPREKGVGHGNAIEEHLSTLLLDLHVMDLCLTMASNGELSAVDYARTSAFVAELQLRTEERCQQITDMIQPLDPASTLVEALRELQDTPRRLRVLTSLRFIADTTTTLQPGDAFAVEGRGVATIVEILGDGAARCITYDVIKNRYDEISLNLAGVSLEGVIISRGLDRLHVSGEEPFSPKQPYTPGVHVMRPPVSDVGTRFERGEILSTLRDGRERVLWHLEDGTVRIELNHPKELRPLSFKQMLEGSSSVLTATALHASRGSPIRECLHAREQLRLAKPLERDSRQLRDICARVLDSEYPIALHIIGERPTWEVQRAGIDALIPRIALFSMGSDPSEDGSHLKRHMCHPVVVVFDSERDPNIFRRLTKLQEQGWQVIIQPDRSCVLEDEFLNYAIADNKMIPGAVPFRVVEEGEVSLPEVLEEIGARAHARLDERVGQSTRDLGDRREAFQRLSASLDALAEMDSTKTVSLRPQELQELRRAVEGLQSGTLEAAATFGSALELSPRAQFGSTETQSSWSYRELVEISAALAKSRLDPSHPAVLLRGITCLDLSPRALEGLLNQGARFFRVADEGGVTRGIVMSLSPEVTEITRPGLSDTLGRPGKTGYVYWIWVDPDASPDIRAVYPKLANHLVLDQLMNGATLIFGRVLERNTPSLRIAFGVGGFDVVPLQIRIGGERAIGVGFDLTKYDETGVQSDTLPTTQARGPRAVLEQALSLFTSGINGASLDEEARMANRMRVMVVHDFLTCEYRLREACEGVIAHSSVDIWWGDRNRLVERAEAALKEFAPWITSAQLDDLSETLQGCTEDDRLADDLLRLQGLLYEVAPEQLRSIKSTDDRLRSKASENLDLSLDSIEPNSLSLEFRYRSKSLPLPPFIDIKEIKNRFGDLPESSQRRLGSWWGYSYQKFSWVSDNHDNQMGCNRHMHEWIEGDLERAGRFCGEAWGGKDGGAEISSAEVEQMKELNSLLQWANEVAQAGHFDKHVARYLNPILRAFVGRQ
jgi:hypothetical protein